MIKYILFKQGDGECIPILFPSLQKHSDIAQRLQSIGEPVEAGFVQVNNIDFSLQPYGESISMELSCTKLSVEAFIKLNSDMY